MKKMATQKTSFTLQPIAHFSTQKTNSIYKTKLSAPRQSGLERGQNGVIHVLPRFRDGLQDLDGFDHIWLVFHFHLNTSWKPLVLPPRSTKKRGVFATRSPYRPNPLGMSCVKISHIDGLQIHVTDADLLEGTPIFDIKPYVTYCDSFPQTKQGWLEEAEKQKYLVDFNLSAQKKIQWLEKHAELPLSEILTTQLESDPFNAKKKRIKPLNRQGTSDAIDYNAVYIFSYRTWRFAFTQTSEQRIQIIEVSSGYSQSELKDHNDPHLDKQIHLQFIQNFKN